MCIDFAHGLNTRGTDNVNAAKVGLLVVVSDKKSQGMNGWDNGTLPCRPYYNYVPDMSKKFLMVSLLFLCKVMRNEEGEPIITFFLTFFVLPSSSCFLLRISFCDHFMPEKGKNLETFGMLSKLRFWFVENQFFCVSTCPELHSTKHILW